MADMGAKTKYATQKQLNEMDPILEGLHDQSTVSGRWEGHMESTPVPVENLVCQNRKRSTFQTSC
ncbi:hypothetical protein RRF57_007070 [Xylaria bambusicola]|uniref:Uncharacterized protein n=1 Tax=Xylaria bambusicola TaxID=326684 RepID=A0AAN7ZA66_9PEZI